MNMSTNANAHQEGDYLFFACLLVTFDDVTEKLGTRRRNNKNFWLVGSATN
jgi:hypothetical protein